MNESEQAAFKAKAMNDQSNAMLQANAVAQHGEQLAKAIKNSGDAKWIAWLALGFSGISAIVSVAQLFR